MESLKTLFGRWDIQSIETIFFLLLLFGLFLSWLSSTIIAPVGSIFACGLLIISIIYISRHSIRQTQPLIWLSLLAVLAHITFALYVIPLVNGYYEQRGSSDVSFFFQVGKKLSEKMLSNPREAITLFFQQNGLSNTAFFWVWGIFCLITGGSLSGIIILFGWFSVCGGFYFVQAFQSSLSDRQKVWYAVLVFFFPSILLWTVMPLKDAIVFWSLGLISYGVSLWFNNQLVKGSLIMLSGELTCMAIRPYYLLFSIFPIIFVGVLCVVSALRSKSYKRTIGDMVIVSLNALLAIFLVSNNFFVGSLDPNYWAWYQQAAGDPTAGSSLSRPEFNVSDFLSLSYITRRIVDIFSVLFRPLPWEAHNIFALFASLENVGLLILTVSILFRVKTVIHLMKSNLMWLFSVNFMVLFVGVYSFQIINLGTMARSKVNVLPFIFPFFVLVIDNFQTVFVNWVLRNRNLSNLLR